MFFRTLTVLCTLTAACASTALASHVGGMALPPGANRLSLGAFIGYPMRPVEHSGAGDDEASSIQFLARGEYGIFPQFSVFLEGGVSDLRMKNSGFRGILGGGLGGGLKACLFDPEAQKLNASLFLEAFGFQSQSDTRSSSFFEYQAALLADFTAENTTTYGGLKVSMADVSISGGGGSFSAANILGAVFGIDYLITPQVFFNGEIQIYDQQAIYVSVGYKM